LWELFQERCELKRGRVEKKKKKGGEESTPQGGNRKRSLRAKKETETKERRFLFSRLQKNMSEKKRKKRLGCCGRRKGPLNTWRKRRAREHVTAVRRGDKKGGENGRKTTKHDEHKKDFGTNESPEMSKKRQ